MCDLSRVFVCVCMVALISAFASPLAQAEEAEAGGGPRPLAESPQALPKDVGPPESYAPSAPEDLAPLLEILDDLQDAETAVNGELDTKQMRYARKAAVCPRKFRDLAAKQAEISERIVAILDELEDRKRR